MMNTFLCAACQGARARDTYGSSSKLSVHTGGDPALLEKEAARSYLLYLKQEKSDAPGSMRIAAAALRLFFNGMLGKGWRLFDLVRSPDVQRLPTVLGREQVRMLLSQVREPRFVALLHLIYGWLARPPASAIPLRLLGGLRVSEAVKLEVRDVQSAQRRIHIREAKGGKDRLVPLPAVVLAALRSFWKTHRHPRLLFPGAGCAWRERGPAARAQSGAPMSVSSAQHCLRLAVAAAGLPREVTLHTLRHSDATHLLEEGVSLRQIASYLGHSSLDTTEEVEGNREAGGRASRSSIPILPR